MYVAARSTAMSWLQRLSHRPVTWIGHARSVFTHGPGKITVFGRSLVLSSLSLLAFQSYRWRCKHAVVYASIKVEDVKEKADYFHGSGETEKLYEFLIQYKDSEDAELLWRLARASRDLAQLSKTSGVEKKRLIYESLSYAEKALEINESCSAANKQSTEAVRTGSITSTSHTNGPQHLYLTSGALTEAICGQHLKKWYAICLSDVGDYEGIKVKISNAYIIRDHFQRAIELNPEDATSIHLIGLWCYTFADLPWYQVKIASALFATPPSSTFQEAVIHFEKAEEVDPNFYSKNLLYLGKSYLKLKNKELALMWLHKAKDYPVHTEEEKEVHREASEILKSLGEKV